MWHANMWDWLSASFMMAGFTLLLVLSVYLVLCLVIRASAQSPDDDFERRPIRDAEHELTWLAS